MDHLHEPHHSFWLMPWLMDPTLAPKMAVVLLASAATAVSSHEWSLALLHSLFGVIDCCFQVRGVFCFAPGPNWGATASYSQTGAGPGHVWRISSQFLPHATGKHLYLRFHHGLGQQLAPRGQFILEDPLLIAQAITNGTATMVSNSYKPLLSTTIGAAAWILECSQTGAVCCGECMTSGSHQEVNTYRLELQGCHAGLLGLLAFSIHHKLEGGTVAFGFSNDAGVNKAAAGNLNVSTWSMLIWYVLYELLSTNWELSTQSMSSSSR